MSSCPLYAGTPILAVRRSIALHGSVTVRRAEATVILIHFRVDFQLIALLVLLQNGYTSITHSAAEFFAL